MPKSSSPLGWVLLNIGPSNLLRMKFSCYSLFLTPRHSDTCEHSDGGDDGKDPYDSDSYSHEVCKIFGLS